MTDVPETRWARTVDGACIAYQDIGEGPVTLLVVHGWVSHLEVYWEQPRYVRFLRRLSRNMRVLVFDKRGIGMSDRVSGSPDLGVLLDDVRAVHGRRRRREGGPARLGRAGAGARRVLRRDLPRAHRVSRRLPAASTCDRSPTTRGERAPRNSRRSLARTPRAWGSEAGAARLRARRVRKRAPRRSPYNDPEFLSWNAKLARYAATPASYEAFERMWFGDRRTPGLGAISAPTACSSRRDDPEDESLARQQASLIPGARAVPVATTSEVIWVPDPEPIVAAIEQFIASVRQEEAALDRMLATILFTDIVGSTDKACELGDAGWTELLEQHNTDRSRLLARYRGKEVKTDRRRLPCHLRRAGASGEMRPGRSARR